MLGVLGEGDGVVGVDDVVAAGTHELGVLGEGAGELNVRVRVVGVGVDVLGVLSVAVVISGTRAEDVAVGVGGVIFGVGAVLGVGLVGVVAPVVEVGLGVGVADAFLPRLGFVDVGIGGGPRADDADVLDADARVEVGAEVGYHIPLPTFRAHLLYRRVRLAYSTHAALLLLLRVILKVARRRAEHP